MTALPLLSLHIRLAHHAVYARQTARDLAELLGFSRNDQIRIATAVSEIVRNAYQHAGGGEIAFAVVPGIRQEFQIQVTDAGPGITAAVLENNAGESGTGLSGARSVMDSFRIDTVLGQGTTITMGKTFPAQIPLLSEADIVAVVRELARRPPASALEELHRQNQDLIRTLNEIQQHQVDWERLYREMEATNRDMIAVHDELSTQYTVIERSESRFRRMVNEVRDYAIFLWNPDGSIVTTNSGAERIFGYSEPEMIGEMLSRILAREPASDTDLEEIPHLVHASGRKETEQWHRRKDGARFFANSVTTALQDGETSGGYVTILRDVSARKRAEDALQAAYQRERYVTEVLQSPLLKTASQDKLRGLSVATHYESVLAEAEVGGDFFDIFPVVERTGRVSGG